MKFAFAVCIQICLLVAHSRAQDDTHSSHSDDDFLPDIEFGDEESSDPCPPDCRIYNDCNGCPAECLCPLQQNEGAPQCGFRAGCEFKPPCRGCAPQCICGGFVDQSQCDPGCTPFEQCVGCEAHCKCPANFERDQPFGNGLPNGNGQPGLPNHN